MSTKMTDRVQTNLKQFSLSFQSLSLKARDIEKAMGRYKKETPHPFAQRIRKTLDEIDSLVAIRGGYLKHHDIELTPDRSILRVANVRFDVGPVIGNQIKGSDSVALFACTVGAKISDLSKASMKKGDMIQAYILDTMGSVTVEKAMDAIQKKLSDAEKRHGRRITNRFSPGYCGWDLGAQHQLFSLFPKDFCGISLLNSSFMVPTKSISGIIGIGKKVKYLDYPCKLCESKNCFRRDTGDDADESGLDKRMRF